MGAHPTISISKKKKKRKKDIQDLVSLEDIKDCVGGRGYVIIFMCRARRDTHSRAHKHNDKKGENLGESKGNLNKSLDQML